ncbi:major facilitator superfamily domain-containing protein [Stachybotrys elegans]|uniref:Major facilitator superfamily domain-containing protein n=1 Tax=Stachybotrys elegans TaxID=80388 RepID=A0A8K0SAJ7_9HYPO|nr:major facilitator superfamily domain-containing protein [Stachybotrys elegans]
MPRTAAAKDPNAFPYWQLTVLAICRFSEPIAFNSILAYSYDMTIDLNGDDTDAPFYSGLLVSAYAVAEALTALGWGTLSDYYGRKPVVLAGLGGVAISCLILGFAQTYWVALLARFIGGALNGNVSVMQTMVAEMVKNPEHEPAAYATQPFVWTLGGIIGSAVGGFLAQPATFYPDTFPPDSIFAKYPYLLPNLASVVVIILAIIQGIFFLEETNPLANPGLADETDEAIDDEADETTPLQRGQRKSSTGRTASVSERPPPYFIEESLPVPGGGTFDIRRNSFGTMHSIDVQREQRSRPVPPRTVSAISQISEYTGPVYNYTIVMIIIALVLIAYHQMAFGALLPIHLLADPDPRVPRGQLDFQGGLGLTLHDVSVYLAVNGFIGLFIQGIIFPVFVNKVGVWYSFISIVALYPTAYVLMPFLSGVPEFTSAGIYISMILQAFYGIISVPTALILLKDATPSTLLLGRVNGMTMSACCAARTISPPLVGIIYSAGGSAAAWFSCAGVAVIGAIQLFWVPRKHIHHVTVENPIIGALHHEDHANNTSTAEA